MIKAQFGAQVKRLRKAKSELSQESFANSINMDRTYYCSIENGVRNVSLENIKKIADGLGLTLSELFEGIEKIKVEE